MTDSIFNIVSNLPTFLRRHKLIQLLLLIFPKSKIQIISFNGKARLFADLSDPNPRNYFLTKTFEPEFFHIAQFFLSSPGSIFFDVGANFGFCSFGLLDSVPADIEYHLFEANTDIFNLLNRSTSLYPESKVLLNHCCVSDQEGYSKLKIGKSNLGASFIAEDGEYTIENLILDRYICEKSILRIDFMKVDIEGWELAALRGATESLSKGIIKAIYIEISGSNLARNGLEPKDIFDFLLSQDFSLYYCKASDFESGIAKHENQFYISNLVDQLTVAKLDQFPPDHQTDILAIHNSSSLTIQAQPSFI
jgi:FkbM family methyltransferase